jgi:CheY-like chemotaxis protein
MKIAGGAPVPYHAEQIALTLEEGGGAVRRTQASGVAISTHRLVLRVRGYCHPGARVTVVLPIAGGSSITASGVLTQCVHEAGMHHTISVQLEQAIDTSWFGRETLAPTAGPQAAPAAEAKPIRVLYIDDHAAERALVHKRLSGAGVVMSVAGHRGEALDLLRTDRFDVVLCDLHLEECSGLELLESAKPALHTGVFAFVSADPRAEVLGSLLQSGADAVFSKPLDFEVLPLLIAGLLAGEHGPRTEPQIDGLRFRDMIAADLMQLRRYLSKGQTEQAVGVCRGIGGRAPYFGYTALSAAAYRAMGALEAGAETGVKPVTEFVAQLSTIAA